MLAFLGQGSSQLMRRCVFPVLSVKLLGLAGSADRAGQWHHGVAYAAGVILSFAALGGVLIALRAGGSAIGWGFQLQSPVVVGLLAYLLFAMGLGYLGVAGIGAGIMGSPIVSPAAPRSPWAVRQRNPGDDRREPVHRALHGGALRFKLITPRPPSLS